jgi:hypothetical protein
MIDILEVVNPLERLKKRPVPAQYVEKNIFIAVPDVTDMAGEDAEAQCRFIIDTEKAKDKVNRANVLKRIAQRRVENLPNMAPIGVVERKPAKVAKEPVEKQPESPKEAKKVPKVIAKDVRLKVEDAESDEDEPEEEEKAELVPYKPVNLEKLPYKEQKPVKEKPANLKDVVELVEEPDEEPIKNAVEVPEELAKRLPERHERVLVKASTYYLSNRKHFIESINKMFKNYKTVLDGKAASGSDDFDLLLHQQLVREYLNMYTPYRGLLLYHLLGTGKSCTSIAVAEGMKHEKRIYLMIPASLETNYFDELKMCGDPLYKQQQFWEFISTDGRPEYIDFLSSILSLPRSYIEKKRGAWLVNVQKNPHLKNVAERKAYNVQQYQALSDEAKLEVDEQLREMITSKYTQINYNAGNLKTKVDALTKNHTINPFDHSVVIIDETHKFISLIVNKIDKIRGSATQAEVEAEYVSIYLYHLLMSATDVRIVFLTGTPVVNYPNEIAILFNMLRGYIKTWNFKVAGAKVDRDKLLDVFHKSKVNTYDYVDVASDGKSVRITRNPFGFVNALQGTTGGGITSPKAGKGKTSYNKTRKFSETHQGAPHYGGVGEFAEYRGVQYDESGNLSDSQFETQVLASLRANHIELIDDPTVDLHMALPDTKDAFIERFLNIEDIEHPNFKANQDTVFKKRVLGLTSYFANIEENLIASFVKGSNASEPSGKGSNDSPFNFELSPMSEQQFDEYKAFRKDEVKSEKNAIKKAMKNKGKNDVYEVSSSSYRVKSRLSCNFVFPKGTGYPTRPSKTYKKDEDAPQEGDDAGEDIKNVEEQVGLNAKEAAERADQIYQQEKAQAMEFFANNKDRLFSLQNAHNVLAQCSYKYKRILENLTDERNVGLHLLYSQFREIEGLGIFRLVLEANGFAEFKIKKVSGSWQIDEVAGDEGKPKFVLYTGGESLEEREQILNIYNSKWDKVSTEIREKLQQVAANNMYGEIIKVIMITSAAAEGISLQNTRFVHLMEPYWHMVRLQQVIGRARRFKSHIDLPKELQNVKVFLYLSVFSEEQLYTINNTIGEGELKNDVSKRDPAKIYTTDQTLFENSDIKLQISNLLLTAVKETSVDCEMFHKSSDPYTCYNLGRVSTNEFISKPTVAEDSNESTGREKKEAKLKALKFGAKTYYYFADEYKFANPMFDIYADNKAEVKVGQVNKETMKPTFVKV